MDSVVAPSPFLLNTSTRATVYLPTIPISQCTTRIVEVNHAPFTSAVTGSTSSSANNSHVVTIQISQNNDIQLQKELFVARKIDEKVTVLLNASDNISNNFHLSSNHIDDDDTTAGEMVQQPNNDLEVKSSNLFYIPSGQCSPSSTMDMDSGTCSDMESTMETTPPPLPKKNSTKLKGTLLKHTIGRRGSFTDSEESESSLSCDSLNSGDIIVVNNMSNPPIRVTPMTTLSDFDKDNVDNESTKLICLPDSLLRDIRDRSSKLSASEIINMTQSEQNGAENHNNSLYSRVKIKTGTTSVQDICKQDSYQNSRIYENDKFYKFHINESVLNVIDEISPQNIHADESFAGYKDINSRTSTIRSSKGTVRGVKNRVRNGIATFLQMQQSNIKNFKEKDAGKVVLYTTSMGVVRETYAKCANVKQILRTLLIKFEERDVFMSTEYQNEIKNRMQSDDILVPQLFVDGQHIGGADQVERLNETGELRQMLKIYKSIGSSFTCPVCGGYRLLPCPSCKGSKKSVHRNHFTTEFVALKCMNCDEVGLVKCYNC